MSDSVWTAAFNMFTLRLKVIHSADLMCRCTEFHVFNLSLHESLSEQCDKVHTKSGKGLRCDYKGFESGKLLVELLSRIRVQREDDALLIPKRGNLTGISRDQSPINKSAGRFYQQISANHRYTVSAYMLSNIKTCLFLQDVIKRQLFNL